jgi:hypothetical protein
VEVVEMAVVVTEVAALAEVVVAIHRLAVVGGCHSRTCIYQALEKPVHIHLTWKGLLIGAGVVAAGIGAGACIAATDGLCALAIADAATEGSAFGGAAAVVSGGVAAISQGGAALATIGSAGAVTIGELAKVLGDDGGSDAAAADEGPAGSAADTPPAAAPSASEEPAGPKATASCNSFVGATAVLMAGGSSMPISQEFRDRLAVRYCRQADEGYRVAMARNAGAAMAVAQSCGSTPNPPSNCPGRC